MVVIFGIKLFSLLTFQSIRSIIIVEKCETIQKQLKRFPVVSQFTFRILGRREFYLQGETMTIKTLRECEWKDIKIGEVFIWEGCCRVLIKMENGLSIYLGNDFEGYCGYEGDYYKCNYCSAIFYKLPLSFQKNFIDWGKL